MNKAQHELKRKKLKKYRRHADIVQKETQHNRHKKIVAAIRGL